MNVEFLDSFYRDIEKPLQSQEKSKILKIIIAIEEAESIKHFPNLKKLAGNKFAYRIRSGDYRLGIFIENNVVQFARFAHRKEIYRLFP